MSLISNILNNNDPFISLANMCPVLSTPIDWKETEDSHVFIVDLPGLNKEEVKIEVDEKRILQIKGDRKLDDHENEDGGRKNIWHRMERKRGEFCRRFRLPDNAKSDGIQASMDNGVLTVKVPKTIELNKPTQRKLIEIVQK
ncbi:chaperone [Lithospermum erythrorhizon]|uniref:Chaperone n=1 Tax=Lithospermum erythrorhizon TaxID=34254 RepID=A0AAV3QIB2_LITER